MKKIIMILFIFVGISTLVLNSNITAYAEKSINNTNPKPTNFNIAVAADWGCNEDAKRTSENIQANNPDVVIAAGDLSYKGQGDCWENIISPFESKLKIAMGDHEYSDTEGGKTGVVNEYLNPLGLTKTYYSFDKNNAHILVTDPYLDYKPGSSQYQFIENDLKTASTNPNIDWILVVEPIPMYTSPSKHPADSTIRDIYHPLFDKYGVDLVFSGDNHNYQRTFPLKYNTGGTNPETVDKGSSNYNSDEGVIYLISGTAGRSHYAIKEQAPFVAKQDDKNFGFLNIDISDKTLKGSFIINGQGSVIDQFTISKTKA